MKEAPIGSLVDEMNTHEYTTNDTTEHCPYMCGECRHWEYDMCYKQKRPLKADSEVCCQFKLRKVRK